MDKKISTFWKEIKSFIERDFSFEDIQKLEHYAEQFVSGKLVYKRFSPQEQHGCSIGGNAHVIASLLAGAEVATSKDVEGSVSDFKRECELAEKQTEAIKKWAVKNHLWIENIEEDLSKSLGSFFAQGGEAEVYDNGPSVIKVIGLDYFIQPIYALDRISLHNAYFPETSLRVRGFGSDLNGKFKIIVEQPYIQGVPVSQSEIESFMTDMGFKLKDIRNWTYFTSEIYLSDMHDENIIKSKKGNLFVIDCDIRINAPHLRANGTRRLTTEIEFI